MVIGEHTVVPLERSFVWAPIFGAGDVVNKGFSWLILYRKYVFNGLRDKGQEKARPVKAYTTLSSQNAVISLRRIHVK